MNRLFVIKGEDMRNIYLARELLKDGYYTALLDHPVRYEDIPAVDCAQISASPCVAILALSTPAEELYNVLQCLCSGSVCFGGAASEAVLSYAKANNIEYHNILENEPFAIMNAIPTAEGALMAVMQNTPYTLHGSRAAVLGYGRIGKAVARLFQACSCEVTVAARRDDALAYAQMNGHRTIRLSDLAQAAGDFDILLNTVPALMLDRQLLTMLKPDALIVELASGKNNIDYAAAKELGIHVIPAGGLPGKVAPASAAKYIKDTILHYLEKQR